MQLEWKALSRALGSPGQTRSAAVGDALAFRAARRSRFRGAAERERGFEINEGLAQYTATVVVAGSRSEAVRSAIEQLAKAPDAFTFVRQLACPTGVAYGILPDEYAPGWTHRIKSGDDLGKLVQSIAAIRPTKDLEAAAASYGGPEIRERGASFGSAGITSIPGEGTLFSSYRTKGDWCTLEASTVLVDMDRGKLTVPLQRWSRGRQSKARAEPCPSRMAASSGLALAQVTSSRFVSISCPRNERPRMTDVVTCTRAVTARSYPNLARGRSRRRLRG
jgi:hypothetical protein